MAVKPAIKAFQKDKGISVTGDIDQGTHSCLVAALGEYAD